MADTTIARLTEQRNRAWRTLAQIEDALGTTDESGLAFILAGGHGLDDIDEYNLVVSEDDA